MCVSVWSQDEYFPGNQSVLTGIVLFLFVRNQSSIMSAELDLSPPEVPEPTFLESVLRYGLFLGAIFQLICILAIIVPTSKGHEHVCVRINAERVCFLLAM